MEKFSEIFGSLVFLLTHKTKMNCEEIFYLKLYLKLSLSLIRDSSTQ